MVTPTEESADQEGEAKRKYGWRHAAVKAIHHRLPITQWICEYNREDAVADLIAGVTLGLTLIPQSIAYASLANVPPQYGLNSAFIGCFVYMVFGTIKEVSIGPTSLMALLTAEYTSHLSPEFVVALCFYVGCVELLMGAFRLGFLLDYISIPVTSGFQSATSIIIILSQVKGILGVSFKSCSFHENVYQLIVHIKETKLTGDFSLGIGCIVFLLLMRKLKDIPIEGDTTTKQIIKKILWLLSISRNFIAVVISACIAYYFETAIGRVPFGLSKEVQPGLPPFRIPNLTPVLGNHTYTVPEVVEELGMGIFIIPTIAVLANVAIAKAFITGGTIDATQEMLTLSFCNILGSFVQSVPTCGAFTRSAVASASGIRTPLAGLYCGILVMLALTFLTPYFHLIPKATLSAVLISAVFFLIDYHILWPLWQTNKREFVVVLVTLTSCLVLGVELGLFLGIILNVCHLVYIWARPHVSVTTRKVYLEQGSKEYVLVTPAIGMYFPAVDVICNLLQDAALEKGAGVSPVVLNCLHFTSVDFSAAKAFAGVVRDFHARGQEIVFLNASPKMVRLFKYVGCKKAKCCNSEVELEHYLFGLVPLGHRNSKSMQGKDGDNHEVVPLIEQTGRHSNSMEMKAVKI